MSTKTPYVDPWYSEFTDSIIMLARPYQFLVYVCSYPFNQYGKRHSLQTGLSGCRGFLVATRKPLNDNFLKMIVALTIAVPLTNAAAIRWPLNFA